MKKRIRLATGDKVEIIDSKSPYFGKTGKLIKLQLIRTEMINTNSKTISSKEEYHWAVKLDDIETTEAFTLRQLRKI